MPKFFFHARQHNARFEDKQGVEFPDLPSAWRWALQDARAISAQQLLDGPIDQQWVEIGDAYGVVIASLPVAAALQLQ